MMIKIIGWLILGWIITASLSLVFALLPVIFYFIFVFFALVCIYALLPENLRVQSFEDWVLAGNVIKKNTKSNQKNTNPNNQLPTSTGTPVESQPKLDFNKIIFNRSEEIPTKEELEAAIRNKVIGQDLAITALTRMVRGKLASKNNPKPLVIFLPGQTGTGKTEISKALAEALGTSLNRFDMGEFGEEHKASNLFGSAAGYIGAEDGGKLPNVLRDSGKRCVILFDEVEKAHQSLWRKMLAFFDEGRISDTLGQAVAPENTICILTSNIEAEKIGDAPDRAKEIIKNSGYFPPEFIGRIDKVIPMLRLSKSDLGRLTVVLAQKLGDRFGIDLIIEQSSLEVLANQTLEEAENYGGRGIIEKLSDLLMDDLIDLQGEGVTKGKLAISNNRLEVVEGVSEKRCGEGEMC